MITDNRFSRIELLLGNTAMARLSSSFVCVVGLGAVGSYAVEALARSGIGHLRVIDFDEIRRSNINRQLYALESSLGLPKCSTARDRILDINPDCNVEAISDFFSSDSASKLLSGPPDLVIDAIDSLNPKTDLLQEVSRRQIPVFSSMGAALRMDPSAIRVGPLKKVKFCPLARVLRRRLRRRGVSLNIPCVYSEEPVSTSSIALPTETPFYDRGRKRSTLGSAPTITGIFGLIAAHQAIRLILSR